MSREIKYIGMDVHKEAVVIAALNSTGQLVMESIVETKAEKLRYRPLDARSISFRIRVPDPAVYRRWLREGLLGRRGNGRSLRRGYCLRKFKSAKPNERKNLENLSQECLSVRNSCGRSDERLLDLHLEQKYVS